MFYTFEKVANPRVDWQVIWKKEFNDEFINAVRNSIEEDKWTDASVGGNPNKPGGTVDKKIRSVMHQKLKMGNYKDLQDFPHCIMADKIIRANSEIWRLDVDGFNMALDPPNILRYKADENGHYDWHLDYGAAFSNRKISFSIQLSDSSEYEGGNLEIMGVPFDAKTRERGTIIMFPSYVRHRVTPVTKGTRYCIVGWVHGPHFK